MSVTDTALPGRIVRVAAKGDGVTADGRFAPLAAPGDELREDGTLIRGAQYRDPPCRHFPECGGCALQHLSDEAYNRFVLDRVANALDAQGLRPDIAEPMLSPPRSRRRATLRYWTGKRGVQLGFNRANSHDLVDVRQCEILRPELFALIAPLRELLRSMAPAKVQGAVQMTLVDQGVDLLVERLVVDRLAAREAVEAFARTHALARFSIDDGYSPETLWEPGPVTVTLGGVAVTFPHGAFLQPTREGEAALVAAVRQACESSSNIADLFAGLGTFALALGVGRKVYAAEASRDAVLALTAAGRSAQRQLFTEHRDLFRRPLQPGELERFDAVILDPPRAGAKAQVEQLAQSRVTRIAYVSCNPSSFARDAKRLCDGGYRLESVQPVGQFRWSTHVELVGVFRR